MTRGLRLIAPAKINWTLEVLNRRHRANRMTGIVAVWNHEPWQVAGWITNCCSTAPLSAAS